MQEIVDVVIGIVKGLSDRLVPRIEALEKREPVPGRDGAQGPMGPEGEKGVAGAPGEPGQAGPAGPVGPTGAQGPIGETGPEGPVGPVGIPGRDGLPGVQGPQGEKGLDGKDGRDGINGKDGVDALGFDDIQVEHDGERGFTFKFVRGERVKTFGAFTVPVTIYRGLFKDGQTYVRGDQTTWGGSMWTAMKTTTARPGEAGQDSRAWVLTAQRGREGKQGPAGAQGERGPRGEAGPQGRSGY